MRPLALLAASALLAAGCVSKSVVIAPRMPPSSGAEVLPPKTLSAAPDAPAASPRRAAWSVASPLPERRLYASFVNVQGGVYAIGGQTADRQATDLVEVLDPASGRWRPGPSLPVRLAVFSASVVGGKIYVVGGCVRSECGDPTNGAWALDPGSEYWRPVAPMPEAAWGTQSAAIDGRLYVFGGVIGGRASARVLVYDPATDRWSRRHDMPRPLTHGAGAVLSGRYYVAGGCIGETFNRYCDVFTDAVSVYSPRTDSWSDGPKLPVAVFGAEAAAVRGRLVVAGGSGPGSKVASRTYVLDPAVGRWMSGPDLVNGTYRPSLFRLGRGWALHGSGPGLEPSSEVMFSASPAEFAGTAATPLEEAAPDQASDLEALPPAVAARPHAYAVVIGIEHYREKLPPAEFSESDARLTAEYFNRVLGVPPENLVLLTDERATKSDFEKYFERWLPNHVEAGDRVYVYYSGHGAPNPAKGEAYLVPYDADPAYIEQTGYPVRELFERLGKLPAKQVYVAMDSCFSGSGGRSVIAPGMRPLVSVVQDEVPRNVTVISASGADQVSSSYLEKRHGLFTYFFLEGLKAKGGDLRAVYDYLRPEVARVARRDYNVDQEPQWRAGR